MLVDIAFNGTSESFRHSIPTIMAACRSSGIMPLIVGLDVESSCLAAKMAKEYETFSYFGIHPLSIASDCFSEDGTLFLPDFESKLESVRERVVAIGECGLDYFRADNKDIQKKVFEYQLSISKKYNLPCFIHCREAFKDVCSRVDGVEGVVHSFDGSLEEAVSFMDKGLYIGINGCSMRSEQGIGVVRKLPLDRILLETDSPYCLIRKSYSASQFVTPIKARENKPYYLQNVADAVAGIKGMPVEEVVDQILENTTRLFPRISDHLDIWHIPKSSSN